MVGVMRCGSGRVGVTDESSEDGTRTSGVVNVGQFSDDARLSGEGWVGTVRGGHGARYGRECGR